MTVPGHGHDDLAPLKDLSVPVSCWHESQRSARHDSVVAVSEELLYVATERPLPEGTPVFFELPLGPAGGPPMAELDAVVVSLAARPTAQGFAARLLAVEPAVRAWLKAKAEEQPKAPTSLATAPAVTGPPVASSMPPAAAHELSPPADVIEAPAAAASPAASSTPPTAAHELSPSADVIEAPAAAAPPAASSTPPTAAHELSPSADVVEAPAATAPTVASSTPPPAAPEVPLSADGVEAPADAGPLETPPSPASPGAGPAGAGVVVVEAPVRVRLFEGGTAGAPASPPAVPNSPPLAPETPAAPAVTAAPSHAARGESDSADDSLDDSFFGDAFPDEPAVPAISTSTAPPPSSPLNEVISSTAAVPVAGGAAPVSLMADAAVPDEGPHSAAGSGISAMLDDEVLDLLLEEEEPEPERSFGSLSLPSHLQALLAPPPSVVDPLLPPEPFDPFADTEVADSEASDSYAPLDSHEFEAKSEDAIDPDDLDIDVFDDVGASPIATHTPPPPRADLPGLAEAGLGFSNRFARAAAGTLDGEERPRPVVSPQPPKAPPPTETLPWGIDSRHIASAAVTSAGRPIDNESATGVFPRPAPLPEELSGFPPTTGSGAPFGGPPPAPFDGPPPAPFGGPPPAPFGGPPPAPFGQPPSAPLPSLTAFPSHLNPGTQLASMNPPGFGPGPPTPRSLAVGGFDPDDDIVEVSSTSQLVALGPGGFPGAATRDLDPRAAAPQGGPSAPSWQGGATMADAWQVSPEAKGELPVVTGTTVPSSNEASRRDEDPWTIEFPPPLQKP